MESGLSVTGWALLGAGINSLKEKASNKRYYQQRSENKKGVALMTLQQRLNA
jgi:hypothetical protein